MARGVGGEGGARGGRDPNAGSSGPKGGGTGNAGLGSGSQRHRNRQAEISRVAKATGTSSTPVGNTGVSKAGRVSSTALGMSRDYRNTGNSAWDNGWNRVASLLGFNEQRPSLKSALDRVNSTPAGQNTDTRAGWGFDPAGLIGGAVGMGLGLPFGGGFIADQLSSLAGRPMEIGLGPSVFGGGWNMPSFGGGPLSPGQGGGQMAGNTGNYGGVLSPQPRTPNSAPQVASQPQQGSPMPSYGSWQQPMQWAQPGMSGLSSWGVQPTQPMFGQPLWSPTGQQQWGQRQPRTHTTGWR